MRIPMFQVFGDVPATPRLDPHPTRRKRIQTNKRDNGAATQDDEAPEEYNAREKYLRQRLLVIIL